MAPPLLQRGFLQRSSLDPARLAASAAARELRAFDALLASSDGDGPPVCAAALRAWSAIAAFDSVLRGDPPTAPCDFIAALECGGPTSPSPGDLGLGGEALRALITTASIDAVPGEDWPAHRELLRLRSALRDWSLALERQRTPPLAAGRRRRLLASLALAVLFVGGLCGVFYRRPVWRVVYYRTANLTDPVASDMAANLGYNWGNAAPHRGVPDDNFSARWESCMVLDRPHAFEFVLGSDDGGRLYVDDAVVVDQWMNQVYTERSATLNLAAGKHALRVEHFDSGGAAELTLRVRIDGQGKPRSIPRSLLRAPGHGAGPCD